MQHLEHIYTKKLLVVYLDFKYGSSSFLLFANAGNPIWFPNLSPLHQVHSKNPGVEKQ